MILTALEEYEIESRLAIQAMDDEAVSLQMALKRTFRGKVVYIYLAHELQMLTKHSFGLAAENHQRHYFKVAFEMFERSSMLTRFFTMPTKRTNDLLRG